MNSLLRSNEMLHGQMTMATPILLINILLQRIRTMTLQVSQLSLVIHNVIHQESNYHQAHAAYENCWTMTDLVPRANP